MNFQRLFDILPYQLAKYPQKVALAGRQHGTWKTYSTEECLHTLRQLSTGLLRLGVNKDDKASILAHCGSPLWNLFDMALQQIGAVVVPIHATTLEKDLAYIFQDAGVKLCLVSNQEMLAKVKALNNSSLSVFSFEKIPGGRHWEELLATPTPTELELLEALKKSIARTDLATIIYTSGTTGQPKGVMLTHRNIVSNIKAILTLVPVNYHKNALSFLPLSHILERMVTYLYMAAGTSVWYGESIDTIYKDMQEVRPHFFTAVPRILERMHDRALETRKSRGALGRRLFDAAIAWGKDYDPLEKLSPLYWIRHQLFDWLVYRQWRKVLGGNVEGVVVGAAALQPRLAKLFCAAGIPVREGYGLTESSPVVAFNHFEPGLYRFGTVGIPVPGVEVKIEVENGSEEGEILVKGPNVTNGYYNQPGETAAVLTPDGWLHTGDVGKFVHRRFLQITDRKRDIFKTSSGKFVAPQRVENALIASPYIQQAMAVGYNQPFVAALIVPEFAALERWCRENNIHWTGPQFMALNPKVLKFMEGILEDINQSLEPHEQVRKFTLLHGEWTAAGGELTFTLKLARNVLKEKFRKEIEAMYKV
ncbi:MAG: long-chain fatty acid--CoA ligase [Lewinellaceae bacterium]|nr:long-chain fatty acid--CoA ligase [Saprospiraceae bacterium]MCB9338279.1 long-chain fatty acid--CoA ligase [Lewinellaceae bacterium]